MCRFSLEWTGHWTPSILSADVLMPKMFPQHFYYITLYESVSHPMRATKPFSHILEVFPSLGVSTNIFYCYIYFCPTLLVKETQPIMRAARHSKVPFKTNWPCVLCFPVNTLNKLCNTHTWCHKGLLDILPVCDHAHQPTTVGSTPSETVLSLIQQSLTHCWQEAKAQRFGSRLSTASIKKNAAPAESEMRS